MLGHWLWPCVTALAEPPPVETYVLLDSGPLDAPLLAATSDVPSVADRLRDAVEGVAGTSFALSEPDVPLDEPLRGGRLVQHAVQRRADAGPKPRLEILIGSIVEQQSADCFDSEALDAVIDRMTEPVGQSGSLDHLAVGLLRVDAVRPESADDADDDAAVDAGWRATLAWKDGCLEVADAVPWVADAASFRMTSAVVVLGFGTAGHAVGAQLDAVTAAISGEGFDVSVVRLPTERPSHWSGEITGWGRPGDLLVTAPVDLGWSGCRELQATATLRAGGEPVEVPASAACDGRLQLSVERSRLTERFTAVAGLDPRVRTLALEGEVAIGDETGALLRSFDDASVLNDSERPVPWWGTAAERFGASPAGYRLVLSDVVLVGLDRRPWPEAVGIASLVGVAMWRMLTVLLYRARMRASLRRAWRDAHEGELLGGPAVGPILEEARQRAASGGWVGRMLLGGVGGVATFVVAVWAVLRAAEVWGG